MEELEVNEAIGNKPPTSVKELGIHFFYMSKHLAEMQKDIKAIASNNVSRKELLTAIEDRKEDQKAIVKDVEELKCIVDGHSAVIDGIKTQITKWSIYILIGMILANYGIQQLFK